MLLLCSLAMGVEALDLALCVNSFMGPARGRDPRKDHGSRLRGRIESVLHDLVLIRRC